MEGSAFICGVYFTSAMTDEELLACIIAAAVHDVGHFGVNNKYLITESHPLAITYNDISVLEVRQISSSLRLCTTAMKSIQEYLLLYRALI